MRCKVKHFLILMILFFSFLSTVFALIESSRLITPENIDSHKLEVKINHPEDDKNIYVIEVTGFENEVAEIGSGLYVFQAEEFSMPEGFAPLYNPRELYPDGQNFEREFFEDTKNGMRKWKAQFSVPINEIEKTYFAIFPPLNCSDGTTYVIDLPRFITESTKE